MEPAKRTDWRIQDFPESYATFSLDRSLTAGEYQKLQHGLVPQDMDQKWFIFHEEGWQYFFRSGTGQGVFRVKVEPQDGGCLLSEAHAALPQHAEGSDTAEALRMVNVLVDSLLR